MDGIGEKMKLSFVIPCYRSEKTIENVIREIRETVKKDDTYEIICVNDCSPDGVFDILKKSADNDRNIKVVSLAKNFGQHNALMAGYHYASGDVIISLDDDGQTPADECYSLIDALDEECDVVYARYRERKHNLFRKLGSSFAGLMGKVMMGIPKGIEGNSYFACKRYIIDEIRRYKNPYTFVGGLIFRTTKKIRNIDVTHRERAEGKSGYSLHKLVALWLNGFTAFSVKPLRFASTTGFVCAGFGFVYGIITVVRKLCDPDIAIGYSSLMAVILLIGGLLMVMMGLVGEYIGRIYISLNNSPQYVIRETLNIDDGGENV